MSSNTSSSYFPPLDKLLAGTEQLISWRTAYDALSSPLNPKYTAPEDFAAFETFLTDTESSHVLSKSLDPFLKPGQKTKADFETKTAPIQVSQSTNGDYDLEQLKKDALWLSEQADVEELAALRIVVLEWQQRAAGQLVAAVSNGGVDLDFSKGDVRRERQLALYLEEKTYILKLAVELNNSVATRDPELATPRTWIDDLADKAIEGQSSPNNATDHEAFCVSCIEVIENAIVKLDDSSRMPPAFRSDDAKQVMFVTAVFVDLTTALRLLLASLYKFDGIPGPRLVSSWFKLVSNQAFFQDLVPMPQIPDPTLLQSLVSIISLTILRTPDVIRQLQESVEGRSTPTGSSYFYNDACIREINLILYRAAIENRSIASPAIYGWSLITSWLRNIARRLHDLRESDHQLESSDGESSSRRRSSTRRDSSHDVSVFEKRYDLLRDLEFEEQEARDDPASFFARVAVDLMNVYPVISLLSTTIARSCAFEREAATSFIARSSLLDLVCEGMDLTAYGAEVVEAILSVLAPDALGQSTQLDARLANRFVADEVFQLSVIEQARRRYPFELSPLLRLFTALSSAQSSHQAGATDLVQRIENMQTLTVMVPDHFRAYTLDHEDENINGMQLTDTLELFVGRRAFAISHNTANEQSNVLTVHAGTVGAIVKENRPLVFQLEHAHSGLEYLGLLLWTVLPNSELHISPPMDALDLGTAAEIVTLFNALLAASLRQHQGAEEAKFVLGRLGYALHGEQDIISVIADIVEMELLAHLDQNTMEGSLQLLIACAEFFDTLTKISPERVWSTLARSSLLGLSGGANALAAVVGGSETQVGQYFFLTACVKIYSNLLSDAVGGLVRRRKTTQQAPRNHRFDSPMGTQDPSTPERTMTAVLDAYQTTVFDAWQSLAEWRFSVPEEKARVEALILDAFQTLLRSSYGINMDKPVNKRIAALLWPSAMALVDSFAPSQQPDESNMDSLQRFGAVLTSAQAAPEAAEFLIMLIRTARLLDTSEESSKKRVYALGVQLLKVVPSLTSLVATVHDCKGQLSTLLNEIVQALNGKDGDTPSLLSEMSPDAGKAFLGVIAQLDMPLRDLHVESQIWSFLSTVLGSKQLWFALYLLTGVLPKDRLRDITNQANRKKSLLSYALDQLAVMDTLPPERATAMLKFVASAQESWVWASDAVRVHDSFLKNCLAWLNNLQPPSRSANVAEELLLANEHQMAALFCDILAANLHASLEVGDRSVLKLLLPDKLQFLREYGVQITAYNRSLHRNLHENFAKKFEGCEVSDFRRTDINPASLGREYAYDLELASKVLRHDMAWEGATVGRSLRNGFADEFARANVNLSLVEAQTKLLKSWRVLSAMLAECVNGEQDSALQSELAQTAERCLQANAEANLEQPGMDLVIEIRADMAFVIVSKLVAVKAKNEAMKRLLPAAWDLVRKSPVDYDVATAAEDLRYWRTLLQVLYLTLQPWVYGADRIPTTANFQATRATDETRHEFLDPVISGILVEIVAKVVAPGFRALCGSLHTSIALAQPADFALITAILQAILSVHGAHAVYAQLAEVIASTSIIRGALSLYSWADRLAEEMNQDPIYGEVAIVFLRRLSEIPPVAEQIALQGGLVQLSSANLSNYFRKATGKGPFDEPARMFSIWTQGFLPLCLNLLDAVGPALAGDVAVFLNGFPQQLKRAESSLEGSGIAIATSGAMEEAHSLCLIAAILASDTARGAADGINPADVPVLEFDYEKVWDMVVLTEKR